MGQNPYHLAGPLSQALGGCFLADIPGILFHILQHEQLVHPFGATLSLLCDSSKAM